MRRRAFIKFDERCGEAWPLAVRAQPVGKDASHRRADGRQHKEGTRRDGRVSSAFLRGSSAPLAGSKIATYQIDVRWTGGSADRIRGLTRQIWAKLAPDVICRQWNAYR